MNNQHHPNWDRLFIIVYNSFVPSGRLSSIQGLEPPMISRYNTLYTKGIVSPEWSPGAGSGTGVLFLGFSGNGCPVPRAMVELCRAADMSSRA